MSLLQAEQTKPKSTGLEADCAIQRLAFHRELLVKSGHKQQSLQWTLGRGTFLRFATYMPVY
jgi:hypothetical protein